MTFKQCRYKCGIMVEVRDIGNDQWRPFEQDGQMHNCPESDYNKQRRQNGNGQQQQEQQTIQQQPQPQQQQEKAAVVPLTSTTIHKIFTGTAGYVEEAVDTYTNRARRFGGRIHGVQHTIAALDGELIHSMAVHIEVPDKAVPELRIVE